MPSLVLVQSDYKHFSWLLWNQFMQALHQQLSDSPATPTATSHPTALTSTSPLRGDIAQELLGAQWRNVLMKQQLSPSITWISTEPALPREGADRAESRNDTYTSLWYLCRMHYGNPRFLSSCHPCSPHSQPFAGLEHPQHHNSLAWHPPMHWHSQSLLLFPPLQDTTHLQPSLWWCFHLIINSFGQRGSFIMCWYSAQKNGVLISRHYCNINNNNSLLLAFSNSRSFTGRWQAMLTCLSTAQK